MHGNCENATVVVIQADAAGQHSRVSIGEFNSKCSAFAHRNREIETTMFDTQIIEVAQGLTSEVADLRIVTLAFELADHHDRNHDRVLSEAEERLRVRQENRRVENVRTHGL